MPQRVPIRDLKHTANISALCHESKERLFSAAEIARSSNNVHPCTLFDSEGLSKNFSFWTVSLDLDAMFKIKSLLYKDLILNSRGCRKSNQLLRHPHRCCVEPPPSVAVVIR